MVLLVPIDLFLIVRILTILSPDACRRRLNARPNVPLGDEIDHYLGQGRGVARVTKEEEKQRIFPIGQ